VTNPGGPAHVYPGVAYPASKTRPARPRGRMAAGTGPPGQM